MWTKTVMNVVQASWPDVTNLVLVWSQCSEGGELRVVRKWLVIRCRGMLLQNREYVQGESATKGNV